MSDNEIFPLDLTIAEGDELRVILLWFQDRQPSPRITSMLKKLDKWSIKIIFGEEAK